MLFLRKFLLTTLTALFLLLMASAAFAQNVGIIQGTVTDDTGAIIPGATVSAVNSRGIPKTAGTNENGAYTINGLAPGIYTIRTIKPGSVAGRKGRKAMAPHVNIWLASRGINIGLATRMYFGDEEAANAEDPVLNIIEQPERRKTLIAPRSERAGTIVYTFDIHLQGDRETVFFDV